ncbi:hypothetical protein CEXT_442071 [Caerostris extrusa]|uniref:Uncharacterized protein n=1 Tax=Caerostris extrusa TaxID=172846 RepID=A0AAV4XXU4_CAEEX|nr:hypothetical protein CEXT_442071 [Caerostris extrusa]
MNQAPIKIDIDSLNMPINTISCSESEDDSQHRFPGIGSTIVSQGQLLAIQAQLISDRPNRQNSLKNESCRRMTSDNRILCRQKKRHTLEIKIPIPKLLCGTC